MGYYNSFVVKVWSEKPGGKVRGHIQHVGTQESSHFLNLDKMLDFIIAHLGPPPEGLSELDEEEALDEAVHEHGNER